MAADIAWLSDEVVNQARASIVTVETSPTTAVTGFFASEDGLVVTTAGYLEGCEKLTVITQAQKALTDVKLLAVSREQDLAVLATGGKAPAHLGRV